MMIFNHILLALGWILFGVVHSLLAATPVKSYFQLRLRGYFKYYRLAYSLLALIMLGLLLLFQFSLPSRLLWITPVPAGIVFALSAMAGLWIMLNTIVKYFYMHSGLSILTRRPKPVTLELDGLHRYVRHPLYAGTLLFIGSLVCLYPLLSHWVAFIVITAYTLIGIRLEERKLLATYGQAYRKYRQRVPMIIPFLRPFNK